MRCMGLSATAVVMLSLVLVATARIASAESDETVTTELKPGWSLAGWTEDASDISAIFEAIPALQAVYAWDAEHKQYSLAIRTDAGLLGDLGTLTPGMGLWLWLDGDQPFTWRRPLSPRAGLVSLHEGWNLVVWAGGTAVADALTLLGDSLEEVVDGGGRRDLGLNRGEAFWLRVSASAEWERGDSPSRIEGVVLGPDGAGQASLTVTADGQRGWESRSGQTDDQGRFEFWVESDVYTLSVSSGLCDLSWSSADHRLDFAPPRLPHAAVDGDAVGFVLELDATPSEFCATLKGVVLDWRGVPLRDVTVGIVRTSDTRRELTTTGDDGWFEWTLGSGTYDLRLTHGDCQLSFSSLGSPLALNNSGRGILELVRGAVAGLVLIPSDSLAGACRWIRGVATDLAGNPRAGESIVLLSRVGTSTTYRHRVTGSDGAFEFLVPRGHYYRLILRESVVGELGYYGGESGFTTDPSGARAVNNLMSSVTGIVLRYGVVSGVVVGSDGAPAPWVRVRTGLEERPLWRTRSDGQFRLAVPRGTYTLEVSCPEGGGGWYEDVAGFTRTQDRATPVTVGDVDVTGLVITLPLPGEAVPLEGCPEPVPSTGG